MNRQPSREARRIADVMFVVFLAGVVVGMLLGLLLR